MIKFYITIQVRYRMSVMLEEKHVERSLGVKEMTKEMSLSEMMARLWHSLKYFVVQIFFIARTGSILSASTMMPCPVWDPMACLAVKSIATFDVREKFK